MLQFQKEKEDFVSTYECSHPSNKVPNILNLNWSESCATSASDYFHLVECFISLIQKVDVQGFSNFAHNMLQVNEQMIHIGTDKC